MSEPVTCPLCNETVPARELLESVPSDLLDDEEEILAAMLDANPDWEEDSGACTRCWEEYARI